MPKSATLKRFANGHFWDMKIKLEEIQNSNGIKYIKKQFKFCQFSNQFQTEFSHLSSFLFNARCPLSGILQGFWLWDDQQDITSAFLFWAYFYNQKSELHIFYICILRQNNCKIKFLIISEELWEIITEIYSKLSIIPFGEKLLIQIQSDKGWQFSVMLWL